MSVCPIFDGVKFDHLVKVVFAAFFFIREDVTLERREMRGTERRKRRRSEKRPQRERPWLFTVFPGPRLHGGTWCFLQPSL